MDDNFHDKIAKICLNHFKTLPKATGKPKPNEWTVLSCILLENSSNLEVVALGTGSKCIGQKAMSKTGDVLNDSHAEIMCRRVFLRFLYEQLSNLAIFNFNSQSNKFKLQNGVKFHFFTTHVPCGDAAIFPKQNHEDFGEILREENKSKRILRTDDAMTPKAKKLKTNECEPEDVFRTGAKCLSDDATRQDPKLPGLEYHVLGVVRTKPGRGDPTLSVSCSDKIAKWCHLGVQGALLSLLIDSPIYLESFTIAGETPFCKKSLERALYGRLEGVNLDVPFGIHKMLIGQSRVGFQFKKDESKQACPSSIAWLKTSEDRQHEVAVEGRRQGVTKKKINTDAGRLKICKLELLKQFGKIYWKIAADSKVETTLTYNSAKQLSDKYQIAWQKLRSAFNTWTRKNCDLLNFCIDCNE